MTFLTFLTFVTFVTSLTQARDPRCEIQGTRGPLGSQVLPSSEVGAFSAVCGVVPLLAPADAVGDHLGNDLVFDFGVNDRLEAVLVKVDRPQAVQKLGIAGWWHQLGSHRKESQQGDSEE